MLKTLRSAHIVLFHEMIHSPDPIGRAILSWLPNGFELSGRGSVHRRQSQHSHNTTSLVNRGASPVASSETLGSVQVQYQDILYSLLSGHRLHSRGVFDLPPAQPHLTHNILDSVHLQLITPDLVETEIQVIHSVIHLL